MGRGTNDTPGQFHSFYVSRSWLAGVLLLIAPALAHAQTATFTTDRKPADPLRLSESLRATLTVEGAAPLTVALPDPLLDPISDRDWKIQPVGGPAVVALGNGLQRWTQAYRLDPYAPGPAMSVIFGPVRVNGREVQPGGFDVKVVSTVTEVKAEAARPVTGIEELPPPPGDTAVSQHPLWWVGGALAIVLLALVAARWRRKPPPVPPHAWAAAAFDRLEQGGGTGADLLAGAAAVVRGFIERQFGVPATRLTTEELLATPAAGAVEQADALRALLDRCDRAKFAGDVPDDGGCRRVLAGCRQWVDDVRAALPGPR
ncbi:Uncharacterized protein OS=uncultured bacterium GN=ACD_75C00779G0002 PE=4 SV=1 [Gemmataceae bacterium]|nr:Uncharacterized protein OS=uncultured bacterium GN=ACD_75C00779G0002 PE=4 SV=1 [Gemmataceae bacterium]VTT96424.1 Uncharacterized protein OS=uncultured bacterium GN=ACD_75C00779G0002 PE=4 SV=1 [Gemmataceae bacterium]